MILTEAKLNPPSFVNRSATLALAEQAARPITAVNELEAVNVVSGAVRRVQSVAEIVLSTGRWHSVNNPGGIGTPEYLINDLFTALDAYTRPQIQLQNGETTVDYPAAQIAMVRLMERSDYARSEGVRVLQKSRQPISDYTVHEIVSAQPALIPDLLGWIESTPEKVIHPGRGEGSGFRVSDAVVELMHAVMSDKDLGQRYGMNVARISLKLAANTAIHDERMEHMLHEAGTFTADRLSRIVNGSEGEMGLLEDVRKQRALMEPVADGFSGKISAKLDEIAKAASKASSSTQSTPADSNAGYVVQKKPKQEEQKAPEKTAAALSADRMRDIVDNELGQIDLALVMGAQPVGLDEFQFLASWANVVTDRFPSADVANLSTVVNGLWKEYGKLVQAKDNQLGEVLRAAEASQDGSVHAYAGYMRALIKMRTTLKGLLLNKMQEIDGTRVRIEAEKAAKEKEAKAAIERKKQQDADAKRVRVAVNVGLNDL